MHTILVLGIALGLDSLRVSVALGTAAAARRVRLALLFGACDGTASLVGLTVGNSLEGAFHAASQVLAALLLGGYGAALALERDRASGGALGRAAVWMPVVLSLDNLGAGVALGGLGAPAIGGAVAMGGISALMAAAGLFAGSLLRTRIPAHAARLGGVILIGTAIVQGVGVG